MKFATNANNFPPTIHQPLFAEPQCNFLFCSRCSVFGKLSQTFIIEIFKKNHMMGWDWLLSLSTCRMPGGKTRQKQKLVLQVLIIDVHHKNNNNRHKNNNNRHKNINNRRPSQKLAKRLDPLSCDQYERIFLDKGCDGSCRTKIANCYFNLVPFSRKTCVCCIADNLLFKVPFWWNFTQN